MAGESCALDLTRQNESLDAAILNGFDQKTVVTVQDVRYSMVVSVQCGKAESFITYDPNGGRLIGAESGEAEQFTVGVSFDNALRPNTERGTDRFEREGFVQIGWNTRPDGSGEHIGLGSRVTVNKGSTLVLYAEWVQESPAEDFTYRSYGKGLTVTGYLGNAETVVLPQSVDGRPVDTVARDAFLDNKTVRTVVLPPSVEIVAAGAFTGCSLEELYLFDNIATISDAAFENCESFSTVHINAYEAPRFGKRLFSEYNLADKYDMLILAQDRRKLVVFGGSGAYNSVDTLQLEEALKEAGEDIVCLNLAVNGWFNGAAQMGIISHFLQEGDIFLHVPETSSGYSLLYDLTMIPGSLEFAYNRIRYYACVELNWDLFSCFDLRTVEDFFDGFDTFNRERETMAETSYTEYKTVMNWYGGSVERDFAYIDERGNMALVQKAGSARSSGEADLVVEYITDEAAAARRNAVYESMEERGVTVLFVYAAINADTLEKRLADPESLQRSSSDATLYYGRPEGIPLPDYESLEEWVRIYEEAAQERISVPILMPLSQSLFATGDFFEPDYHLSDDAAPVFTARILSALEGVLEGGGER